MSSHTMTAGTGRTTWARTSLRRARCAPRGSRVEPAAARVRVRLTRRARLMFTLVAMLGLVGLMVVLAVVVTGGSAASAGTSASVSHQRVTVTAGQTLWEIAQRAAPGTDPRETIDTIFRLNNLKTAEVQVGTALLVP